MKLDGPAAGNATFELNQVLYNKYIKIMIITANMKFASTLSSTDYFAALPSGYKTGTGGYGLILEANGSYNSCIRVLCNTGGGFFQSFTAELNSIQFFMILPIL